MSKYNLKNRLLMLLYPIRRKQLYLRYKTRLPSIKISVFSKPKIRIVFFVLNVGMWKSNRLYELLRNNSRFELFVVSFLHPRDSKSYQERVQNEMKDYFQSQNMNFIEMFDFNNQVWLDIKTIAPDIIFYPQPYGSGYKEYSIKSLWENSIFYYIPYCLDMEEEEVFYNTLLYNICVKVFAPTEYHKKLWSLQNMNKGSNIVVTGYPSWDDLIFYNKLCKSNIWKRNDEGVKHIIWAPHHSIFDEDVLHYSNFLSMADDMLALTNKYKGKIEFAFKPHPRLRTKLERHPLWGVERTKDYYDKWMTQENTVFINNDYMELFNTSDALIHDCSTFMGEYLLTGKPLMFIKNDKEMPLNEFGLQCLEKHYIGRSINDIEDFIDDVVIRGNDIRKQEREQFVRQLMPKDGKLVADRIYEEIVNDLL